MIAAEQSTRLPRKVLLGTCIFPHYGNYPGLDKRLKQIEHIFTKMGVEAKSKHPHKSLDLMLLPEHAVTGGGRPGTENTAADKAMPWDGQIADFFGAQAKKYNSYIAVPMHEVRDGKFYNSIVLVDRSGKRAGVYDKCFPVVDETWNGLEDGITPGEKLPVFDCDFGRVGFQICFDMSNDALWKKLEDEKAELVAWCTASPQTIQPQMRALKHKYWIVSSTMRNNATVFQPATGFIHAQTTDHNGVLLSEIDLSYLQIPWMPALRNGKGFSEKFGDKVGFKYSEREDGGLFWSNDPKMSIDEMAKELGLYERHTRVERSHELNPHW